MKLGKYELNKLYLGDCLDLMKDIPDNSIDLVLTDPPYGITNEKWDIVPKQEYFNEIFRISKNQLIFGGQFFNLPKKEGWIIWYRKAYWLKKQFTRATINEAELIWISKNIKTKVIEYHSLGNIEGFRGEKLKPNYKKPKAIYTSQKPVRLIKYIIETFFEEAQIILDPFIGSGTTAIACKILNRRYLGFEMNKKYIEIAKARLKAVKEVQDKLFQLKFVKYEIIKERMKKKNEK